MEFERPPNFKVPLSKTMEMVTVKEDLLHRNPKAFLDYELFKLRVLTNVDVDHTEVLYSVADGKNVLATFEKLKREVQDLQFADACGPKLKLTPVASYFDCVGSMKFSEIKFITKKENFKPVEIHLSLQDQPKSVLSSKASTGKAIRLKIAKKVPSCTRLKDSFSQFMNGGGLLIDFITLSLWPALVIAEEQEREELNVRKDAEKKQKLCDTSRPDGSRLCSGRDRTPTFSKDGLHRDSNQGYRVHSMKIDEGSFNAKGSRIPHRHEATVPREPRSFPRNHGHFNTVPPYQGHMGGIYGGNFSGSRHHDNLPIPPLIEISSQPSYYGTEYSEFPQPHSQSQPTYYEDNKSYIERERGGGRYGPEREVHRGSDDKDWRKDLNLPTIPSNN
ncbi:hypothetical protein GCK72_010232 [Caenorhabditis remanei]|uniref:Uncharacterized protein n=1 Tax=Caenorhabditis remanei TaxID=31234 RepID=A0A6A5H6G8_CAERE|nr:hypothetical protein GCK72_010232 [Caenorhabditis remanei]KAF1761972.1 hypothetical protein GCK72_010232 [Caenorhabditis remanei]